MSDASFIEEAGGTPEDKVNGGGVCVRGEEREKRQGEEEEEAGGTHEAKVRGRGVVVELPQF